MTTGANAAFWAFALDFYSIPGAQVALLGVQDDHGGDVMAVLWALAATSAGRRLSHDDLLAYAEATAAAAQRAEGLRARRHRLKSGKAQAYADAKAAELSAERAVAASAPDPFKAGAKTTETDDVLVRANIAMVLDALEPPVPEKIRDALVNMLKAKKA
jgi:uncharacterized protein (TIGR02444 family)